MASGPRVEQKGVNHMRLVIRVEDIKGRCPVYQVGDQIVLDNGYRLNLQETTAACMHSLASIRPYHIALAKGVRPDQMGLAHKDRQDGKAYVSVSIRVNSRAGARSRSALRGRKTDAAEAR